MVQAAVKLNVIANYEMLSSNIRNYLQADQMMRAKLIKRSVTMLIGTFIADIGFY